MLGNVRSVDKNVPAFGSPGVSVHDARIRIACFKMDRFVSLRYGQPGLGIHPRTHIIPAGTNSILITQHFSRGSIQHLDGAVRTEAKDGTRIHVRKFCHLLGSTQLWRSRIAPLIVRIVFDHLSVDCWTRYGLVAPDQKYLAALRAETNHMK